jgi:hypothetical protein
MEGRSRRCDPLPYGIGPNRATFEQALRGAEEQKIIAKAVTVEELFPGNTHALVG